MKLITQEWLNRVCDDLDVIKEIADIEHLTNMVAFHSQQAVEKTLKAVLEEHDKPIPKIHNLVRLLNLVKDIITFNVDEMILKEISDVYTDVRYPAEIGGMPYGKPTLEDAKRFYEFAQYIYENTNAFLKTGTHDNPELSS